MFEFILVIQKCTKAVRNRGCSGAMANYQKKYAYTEELDLTKCVSFFLHCDKGADKVVLGVFTVSREYVTHIRIQFRDATLSALGYLL